MAEPGDRELDLKPGLYKKTEKPIDVSRASVGDMIKLAEVSEKTGTGFTYDGDNNTVTPERFVVVPKKKVLKAG